MKLLTLKAAEYRKPNTKSGWIYAIRIVGSFTKIGITYDDDPFKRLTAIQNNLPYETEIIGGAWRLHVATVEANLHRHFSAKRIKGEWFSLDEADILFVFRYARLQKDIRARSLMNDPEELETVRRLIEGAGKA